MKFAIPHGARIGRWEAAVGGLALFVLISRLLLRSRVPVNWDAVQYALALHNFDVTRHQPHPPGNPLYVLLGRAAHWLISDPNQALVAVSIVASIVAVCGTALLGARLVDRRAGFWAALLLAVNPLFWYYGEAALSYVPEAAAGVLMALAVWRVIQAPDTLSVVLASVALALAGGLRPTVLPLLGPLWLLGLVWLSWRQRGLALVVLLVGCLAWAIPLVVVTGGPVAYWTEFRRLTEVAVEPTSLMSGPSWYWWRNLLMLLGAVVLALNVFGVLIGVALARRRPAPRPDAMRTVFLWVWIVPAMAMFSLVLFGQWGYLLLILPPMLLLGLLVVERVWPLASRGGASRLALAGAVSALIFLGTPALSVNRSIFQPTRAAIARHDATWHTAISLISSLPPGHTVVLTSADGLESFRLASYLLPVYQVVGLGSDWQGDWGDMYISALGWSSYRLDPSRIAQETVPVYDVAYIVLLDQSLADRVDAPNEWLHLRLDDGSPLWIRSIPSRLASVSLSEGEISVVPETALQEGIPSPPITPEPETPGAGVSR